MLLLDMSASGNFGTVGNLKADTAVEYAATIAFNAIKNNDKVGAILFTDQVEKYIPPKKGSGHVWRVIKEFYTYVPEHTGTDIKEALSYLGRVSRKKIICFLISDFISDDYLHQLKVVAKKHEIIGVVLSDPGDFKLPRSGMVHVTDLESGEVLVLDAGDKKTRMAYEKNREWAYEKIKKSLKSADVDCIEAKTNGSVPETLTKYFRLREKKIK